VTLEAALQTAGGVVRRGGTFDRWDLEFRGGLLGAARLRMAVEEHGSGAQLVRLHAWPRCAPGAIVLTAVLAALAIAAAHDGSRSASFVLGAFAVLLGLWTASDCAAGMAGMLRAIGQAEQDG
jgi:hypothetical protein